MADKPDEWQATMRTSAKVGSVVKLGDYVVPRKITVTMTGDDDGVPGRRWPDVTIQFEVRDGAAVCTDLRIVSKPGDRPIRTADLSVFDLDKLAELGFGMHAGERDGSGYVFGRDSSGAAPQIRNAVNEGYREPLAELREVARVYLDPDARRKPTLSVQNILDYKTRITTSRRIKLAREKGLIPPVGASSDELDAAWRKLTTPPASEMSREQKSRLVRSMSSSGPDFQATLAEIHAEMRDANNGEEN